MKLFYRACAAAVLLTVLAVSQHELLDRLLRLGEQALDVDGFEWQRTLRYYPGEVDCAVDRVPEK